jgi:hypothetical protein
MARDVEYRWVGPRKACEAAGWTLKNLDGSDLYAWLRERLVSGKIRAKFDDIEITPLIARLLLEGYDLKFPDNGGIVPPDLYICLPDVRREQELPLMPHESKKRGRPKGAGSLKYADWPLTLEMNKMISTFGRESGKSTEEPWPTFASPQQAATYLVDNGKVSGAGSRESKIKRLVRRYLERFGEDG